MNTNNPKNADLHDRLLDRLLDRALLDRALREVVGQETPPDLSKKILAAVGEEKPQPLATLGDEIMTTQKQQTRRKRNFYLGAVLAASLLVGATLSLSGLKSYHKSSKTLAKAVAHSVEEKPTQSASDLRAIHDEVSQQLQEKIERYQTLAQELGGAESSVVTPVLNMQINELRRLKGEIIRAKEKMINRDVARQLASSSVAIEHAVAQALDNDPKLANYKAKEFALLQRIRQSRQTAVRREPVDIKRLEHSLQTLQQESQKYRMLSERKNRIARLEKDFATKLATIERMGGQRSGDLSRLESEIEKLQDIENALEVHRRKQAIGIDQDPKVVEQLRENLKNYHEISLLHAEIEQFQALEQGQGQGQGPDASGDQYTRIYENPFIAAQGDKAVSTFSIDVDTASYANVRQFLMQSGQLPPPDAVRIEELVNYFSYDYTAPTDDTPFAAHVEIAGCPWHPQHRLLRVGIKGREMATERRPQSNLVFLIDVSGSMNQPNKLPLLVEGLKMLTRQLGENDRVAIVVYASSEGRALPSTRGDQQATILAALEKLRAGGSTAGGAGIQLAYKIAQENYIEGGVNRVILATDGDFNVGTTSTGELERLAESNAQETGVFLTVLGFGRGNLNDTMMEAISGKGNGNYHYVDNRAEARKVLVEEIAGTLVTIAKDVKIQIEFNPAQVAAYRLIGYENRLLETQDFNDDKKDAGEIGAGHTVTAIYEVVPAGVEVKTPAVDPLKYQLRAEAAAPVKPAKPASDADAAGELLTLKIRYKQPDGDRSTKLEFPITDNGQPFAKASGDFKFASAVASFGMLLRNSEHSGNTSYAAVLEIAEEGSGKDLHGYRAEFLQLVRQAKQLAGE